MEWDKIKESRDGGNLSRSVNPKPRERAKAERRGLQQATNECNQKVGGKLRSGRVKQLNDRKVAQALVCRLNRGTVSASPPSSRLVL